MLKLIIFIIVSSGIALLSRSSLRNPRSHGFYRFFAFESILALILLNLEHWFRNPFAPLQIISWLLLLASLIMASCGFYLLHTLGKPEKGIENTLVLVKSGIYKYIRHPLYSSLLLLGWGVFFKNPSIIRGILIAITCAALVVGARVEEAENLCRFGTDYTEYKKTTKMFIPFLF